MGDSTKVPYYLKNYDIAKAVSYYLSDPSITIDDVASRFGFTRKIVLKYFSETDRILSIFGTVTLGPKVVARLDEKKQTDPRFKKSCHSLCRGKSGIIIEKEKGNSK